MRYDNEPASTPPENDPLDRWVASLEFALWLSLRPVGRLRRLRGAFRANRVLCKPVTAQVVALMALPWGRLLVSELGLVDPMTLRQLQKRA